MQDQLLRGALVAFFEEQRLAHLEMLVSAVQQSIRDTMKEAKLAGKVSVYTDCLREMERFAKEQIKGEGNG